MEEEVRVQRATLTHHADGTKRAVRQRPLTEKQKKLLKALATSGSFAEARRKAGYAKGSLTNLLTSNTSGYLREKMREALEAHGVTADYLAEKIRDGSEAMKVEVNHRGEVVELGADWYARFKLIELGAKLSGAMPDPRAEMHFDNANVVIVRATPSLDSGEDDPEP